MALIKFDPCYRFGRGRISDSRRKDVQGLRQIFPVQFFPGDTYADSHGREAVQVWRVWETLLRPLQLQEAHDRTYERVTKLSSHKFLVSLIRLICFTTLWRVALYI